MKPKKRQKLCCNCDGEIDLDVIVCPYCAADLREEKPELQRAAFVQGCVRPHGAGPGIPEELPPETQDLKDSAVPVVEEVVQVPEESEPQLQHMLGTVLLLTVGVQLLLLGFLLVFLSSNGVLTLKWNANLWFLYIFASVPFLIFGYRSLSKG